MKNPFKVGVTVLALLVSVTTSGCSRTSGNSEITGSSGASDVSRQPASEGSEVCAVKSPESHFSFEHPELAKAGRKAQWIRNAADLNSDGTEEILLTSSGCAKGNCPTLIYQKQGASCFRSLGRLPAKPEILSDEKNGYRVIEIAKQRYLFDPLLSEYSRAEEVKR